MSTSIAGNGQKHVALVIEDDATTAEFLCEHLKSIDHLPVHCKTLEEVRTAIRKGGWCYALLDMQFPRDADSPPSVASGDVALVELRAVDPRRNENDYHRRPILILTAYSQELDFAWKMGRRGADEFIPKPFAQRMDKVLDIIREALRLAGRTDHGACAGLASNAAPVLEANHADAAPGAGGRVAANGTPAVRLVLDGMTNGQRTDVVVNGERREVQNTPFLLLMRLVAEHFGDPKKWIPREDLDLDKGSVLPGRLRAQLRDALPEGYELIQCDKGGRYRLNPAVAVTVAWAAFSDHAVDAVKRIARENRDR
jgi:DNA-binding response OmpR family regulator